MRSVGAKLRIPRSRSAESEAFEAELRIPAANDQLLHVKCHALRKRLLNLLTAVSLLLCLVVVAFWIVDHGETRSRDVFVAAGQTGYGLFFDGDDVNCGIRPSR